MSKIDLDAPVFFICVAAVLIVGMIGLSYSDGMTYYERQAYEAYLEVCREQKITPEPPFDFKDFDIQK